MSEDVKFCKDCAYYIQYRCGAFPEIDLVTGSTLYRNTDPYSLRNQDGLCGPEGSSWKKKEAAE